MRIRLYLKLCNTLNTYIYKVKIRDENNKLILNKETDWLGRLCFNIEKIGLYKIIVYNNKVLPKKQYIIIRINKNTSNNLVFYFNRFLPKKLNLITFNLNDSYYKNLPIEKGQVILWQDNT